MPAREGCVGARGLFGSQCRGNSHVCLFFVEIGGGFVSGLVVSVSTVDGEKNALACSNEGCKCVVVFGENCREEKHGCGDR